MLKGKRYQSLSQVAFDYHRHPLVGATVLRSRRSGKGQNRGPGKPKTLRCAIYTRKSSEEGLEQEFNSLRAQREACESFIRSQQGEGWKLIKTHYDDGGFSAEPWSAPPFSDCLRTSVRSWSTLSWYTRLIG